MVPNLIHFLNHSFQYAIFSGVVFIVAQSIMKTSWDSIDEINTVDNTAMMHRNFSGLIMSCMVFLKFLEPFIEYAMSIATSKELYPSIEKSVKIKIESSPTEYSEISGATYTKIKEFNAARNQKKSLKSLKAQKLRPITMVEAITEQPKKFKNVFTNKETVS